MVVCFFLVIFGFVAGVVEWLLLLFFGCGQCLEIE